MGHSELLMTIGAIVAFAIASFSINQNSMRNSEAIYATQAEFYATMLAQRFIEETKTEAFDQNTITATADDVTDFSATLALGGSESYLGPTFFNDVDDYNGLTRTENTAVGPMQISISVIYVDESNLNADAGSQRYFKKMTVTVQSAYLNSPVRAHYVFSFQRNP